MYISDTLYGKHNQKTSYLKSHPRTSNPQKQFRTSLSSTLLFPIGEGKVICQRQTTITQNIVMKMYQYLNEHTFTLQHNLIIHVGKNVEYKLF